jgi:alcohol dehydrogenase class IV
MKGTDVQTVRLLQPKKIVFGPGCAVQCAGDLVALGLTCAFVATSPPIAPLVEPLADALNRNGVSVTVYAEIATEPTIETFQAALEAARAADTDAAIGVGGGSVLDVAKLVAAFCDSRQDVRDAFGIDRLASRHTYCACLPTTSGTGSEVSPNAILLDMTDQLKKGVISPYLVPDAAYVDPLLTVTAPSSVTAGTGLDALTHCIEAYANRFAHPMVDLYALQGIRLIGSHLLRAVDRGDDLEARTALALASLYGGLCLGPVNTAAVHALAYPLGGEFHVAHGVSNAVLLPHVLEFNLPAAPERYAQIAVALGVEAGDSPSGTARRGLDRIRELSRRSDIPGGLHELGVPAHAIPHLAESAMTVTRLLKNNVRELTLPDAEGIYRAAY